MTIEKIMKVFQENKLPPDTVIVSNSGWECGPSDIDGIFYNPDKGYIEINQGIVWELTNYEGWKCLSLGEDKTSVQYDSTTVFYIEPETRFVKKKVLNTVEWFYFALDMCDNYDMKMTYDGISREENSVFCPKCGKSIYEENYPYITINDDGDYICPFCKEKIAKEVNNEYSVNCVDISF